MEVKIKTIEQAVVFAILMENNHGIVEKAPGYLIEKLESVSMMDHPERLLDGDNTKKFNDWKERWKY